METQVTPASSHGFERDELRFVIRRHGRIVARVYLAVNGLVAVVILLAAVFGPHLTFVARIALVAGLLAVFVPLFVWGKRRLLDSSVRATPAGLLIYNGVKHHFVAWDEVAGFKRSWRPYLYSVKRKRGRPVTMDAVTGGAFGNIVPQKEQMAELEQYWHRMRALEQSAGPVDNP